MHWSDIYAVHKTMPPIAPSLPGPPPGHRIDADRVPSAALPGTNYRLLICTSLTLHPILPAPPAPLSSAPPAVCPPWLPSHSLGHPLSGSRDTHCWARGRRRALGCPRSPLSSRAGGFATGRLPSDPTAVLAPELRAEPPTQNTIAQRREPLPVPARAAPASPAHAGVTASSLPPAAGTRGRGL